MRAALGLPLWLATSLALAATAGVAWWLRHQLPAAGAAPIRSSKRLVLLVVALLSCASLYSRTWSGLPAAIGLDGGNHAFWKHQFVAGNANAYSGFVSMYLAWDLVERLLHVNAFWALVVIFYGQIVLFAAFMLAVLFSVLGRFEAAPRAWRAGAAAGTAGALAGMLLIVMPLEHYLQLEGFWSQILGLVPLLMLWWLDATLRDRRHRLLAWVVGIVLYRYTYGLNLTELILAFGVIAFAELAPWRLVAATAVAGLALVGAGIVGRQFSLIAPTSGWYAGYNVKRAIAGGAGAAGALLVAAVGNRAATRGLGLWRALRLPLLFATGSLGITEITRRVLRPLHYYTLKYPFQGICILTAAGAVALAAVAATLYDRRKKRLLDRRDLLWALTFVGLLSSAFVNWMITFSQYRATYLERIRGDKPGELRPLVDLGAWSRIDETLALEKKRFGGYLVAYGPMSNFINSNFGIADGQKFYFEGRPPRSDRGYCVFWDASRTTLWPDWEKLYAHRALVDRLDANHASKCVEYPAPWNASEQRRLCHLCR